MPGSLRERLLNEDFCRTYCSNFSPRHSLFISSPIRQTLAYVICHWLASKNNSGKKTCLGTFCQVRLGIMASKRALCPSLGGFRASSGRENFTRLIKLLKRRRKKKNHQTTTTKNGSIYDDVLLFAPSKRPLPPSPTPLHPSPHLPLSSKPVSDRCCEFSAWEIR